MSERCPLFSGEHTIGSLPSVCLHQCEPLWSEALRTQTGYSDYYGSPQDKEECDHERHEVEHSHEGLEKPDSSARRNYAIVDLCAGCETELMETVYQFECPYNQE